MAHAPATALKIRPLTAVRAFRRLARDPNDTRQVFEIMRALNGRATEHAYRRLLATSQGGAIAYRREELAERLGDDGFVRSFPPGSVADAYRRFVEAENLSAAGLVAESRRAAGARADLEHPYAWFGRRIRDTHDLWHVLSGYGRDPLGELCLVAFTFAQTRAAGWGFIAAGGVLRSLRYGLGLETLGAVLEAWRRGRACAWLPAEEVDTLLKEPIGAARARLRLAPAPRYAALRERLLGVGRVSARSAPAAG